jgi:hypothetical protein
MKIKFLKLIVWICGLFVFVPCVMWDELTLLVPTPSWQEDLNIGWSTSISTDRTELIDVINIVNKYLWFSLWLIAMAIFVYAGILLIVWWKKDNFDKANKMLLGAWVAIVISMLSYTIVSLLINLF